MSSPSYTNALIHSQSPYLKQHAHNPVDWIEWNEEAISLAKQENRLLLISIGYAACHWCHVMERESFEDEEVASLMNQNYLCIKIDREERPDLDQVYMQALQLLSGQGGWPLNIVALPDGRAVWGGTYFPKENWMNALGQIAKLHTEQPLKLRKYAGQLVEGMLEIEAGKEIIDNPLSDNDIDIALSRIEQRIDPVWGGMKGAPKFMMPTLIRLWMSVGGNLNEHAHFSLEKMGLGGLFDVVEGGFSRYSVDERWHVPHFEKMGYDNGQLIETFSLAYRQKPSALYSEVVEKTINFLNDNLKSPEGGFYASLDADSTNLDGELEEGAFYVWNLKEIEQIIKKSEHKYFKKYYNINSLGKWEKDNFILFRTQNAKDFSIENKIPLSTISVWESDLLKYRLNRSKPRLDDKIICGWNALIGSGLLAAYQSFNNPKFKKMALGCLENIEKKFVQKNGQLLRINNFEGPKIDGFLEDYATSIKCFIDAYETLFDNHFLLLAKSIAEYSLEHFKTGKSPLFYFSKANALPVQTKETNDNVIPSSNALMAENLIRLAVHLDISEWHQLAVKMCKTQANEIRNYPSAYSYWSRLIKTLKSFKEIVIIGPNAEDWAKELQRLPIENISWAISKDISELPLFKGRFKPGKTLIYYCKNKQCNLPVDSIIEFKGSIMQDLI